MSGRRLQSRAARAARRQSARAQQHRGAGRPASAPRSCTAAASSAPHLHCQAAHNARGGHPAGVVASVAQKRTPLRPLGRPRHGSKKVQCMERIFTSAILSSPRFRFRFPNAACARRPSRILWRPPPSRVRVPSASRWVRSCVSSASSRGVPSVCMTLRSACRSKPRSPAYRRYSAPASMARGGPCCLRGEAEPAAESRGGEGKQVAGRRGGGCARRQTKKEECKKGRQRSPAGRFAFPQRMRRLRAKCNGENCGVRAVQGSRRKERARRGDGGCRRPRGKCLCLHPPYRLRVPCAVIETAAPTPCAGAGARYRGTIEVPCGRRCGGAGRLRRHLKSTPKGHKKYSRGTALHSSC